MLAKPHVSACRLNSDLLVCRKFTLIFTANFVGLLNIRVSRELSPTEVRNPEIYKGDQNESH